MPPTLFGRVVIKKKVFDVKQQTQATIFCQTSLAFLMGLGSMVKQDQNKAVYKQTPDVVLGKVAIKQHHSHCEVW